MFFDNWIYGVAYGNKSENQAPRMRKISKVLKTLRISRVGMPRIHARGEHIRLACKLCSWKREAPTSNEVKWWVVHLNNFHSNHPAFYETWTTLTLN